MSYISGCWTWRSSKKLAFLTFYFQSLKSKSHSQKNISKMKISACPFLSAHVRSSCIALISFANVLDTKGLTEALMMVELLTPA